MAIEKDREVGAVVNEILKGHKIDTTRGNRNDIVGTLYDKIVKGNHSVLDQESLEGYISEANRVKTEYDQSMVNLRTEGARKRATSKAIASFIDIKESLFREKADIIFDAVEERSDQLTVKGYKFEFNDILAKERGKRKDGKSRTATHELRYNELIRQLSDQPYGADLPKEVERLRERYNELHPGEQWKVRGVSYRREYVMLREAIGETLAERSGIPEETLNAIRIEDPHFSFRKLADIETEEGQKKWLERQPENIRREKDLISSYVSQFKVTVNEKLSVHDQLVQARKLSKGQQAQFIQGLSYFSNANKITALHVDILNQTRVTQQTESILKDIIDEAEDSRVMVHSNRVNRAFAKFSAMVQAGDRYSVETVDKAFRYYKEASAESDPFAYLDNVKGMGSKIRKAREIADELEYKQMILEEDPAFNFGKLLKGKKGPDRLDALIQAYDALGEQKTTLADFLEGSKRLGYTAPSFLQYRSVADQLSWWQAADETMREVSTQSLEDLQASWKEKGDDLKRATPKGYFSFFDSKVYRTLQDSEQLAINREKIIDRRISLQEDITDAYFDIREKMPWYDKDKLAQVDGETLSVYRRRLTNLASANELANLSVKDFTERWFSKDDSVKQETRKIWKRAFGTISDNINPETGKPLIDSNLVINRGLVYRKGVDDFAIGVIEARQKSILQGQQNVNVQTGISPFAQKLKGLGIGVGSHSNVIDTVYNADVKNFSAGYGALSKEEKKAYDYKYGAPVKNGSVFYRDVRDIPDKVWYAIEKQKGFTVPRKRPGMISQRDAENAVKEKELQDKITQQLQERVRTLSEEKTPGVVISEAQPVKEEPSLAAKQVNKVKSDIVKNSAKFAKGSIMAPMLGFMGTVGIAALFDSAMSGPSEAATVHRRRVEEERRLKRLGFL